MKLGVEIIEPVLNKPQNFENSELVLNMLKNADLAMLKSMPYEEQKKLANLLDILLAQKPALTDKMIGEGLGKNAHHVTFILSILSPDYIAKNVCKFKLTDFTAGVKVRSGKEVSVIWILAGAALNGMPKALLAVLNQYKGQFYAADFNIVGQYGPYGPYKEASALIFLATAARMGKPELLMSVLAQVAFDHQTLTKLIKVKLPEVAQTLVTANMALSALFESGSIDEQMLFSHAKAANLAGFIEVYYHLGKYFEKMNMPNQAVRSFLLMPDDSYNLEPICREYSARFIGTAVNSENSLEKLTNLDTALKFALKINDDEKRHATLQTIARLYINQALQNGTDVGNEVIPPHLLEVMHGQIDSSWCFKVFQQLAETVQLKLSNKKLTEKLEKSKSKRALEQETRQLLAPIKELLSHFENEKRQAAEKTKKARPNEAEDKQDLCLDTNCPKEATSKIMTK